MKSVFDRSLAELRERISDVRYEGEGVAFTFDGRAYVGALRARNRDLILTGSRQADAAVSLRSLLDGDANVAP